MNFVRIDIQKIGDRWVLARDHVLDTNHDQMWSSLEATFARRPHSRRRRLLELVCNTIFRHICVSLLIFGNSIFRLKFLKLLSVCATVHLNEKTIKLLTNLFFFYGDVDNQLVRCRHYGQFWLSDERLVDPGAASSRWFCSALVRVWPRSKVCIFFVF